MQSVTELLQQLVRIPSVNPDGDPGTEHTGEQNLAEWLADFLGDAGFEVSLETIRPGRPNLIARCPGPEDRPRILLGPHLDTVGVGGMTIDPFGGEIRDGRLWGRGASDTKGPMAAMIWGLLENRDRLAELSVAVDFVAFMSEESGQWGSKDFAERHGHQYEFAIAGEPTSLDIVHVTKGSLWATLVAKGVAAHASQPERGENAILKLSRTLVELDRTLVPRLAEVTHPVLGHSTLNIGIVHGGTRANIVPDRALAQVDIRTVPAFVAEETALTFLRNHVVEHDLPVEVESPVENPRWRFLSTTPGCAACRKSIQAPARWARPGSRMPPTSTTGASHPCASARAPSIKPTRSTSSSSFRPLKRAQPTSRRWFGPWAEPRPAPGSRPRRASRKRGTSP